MKTDATLQKDVLAELEYEPRIDASKIGVTVNDGIVTLSGKVKTYMEKKSAERAALRVAGVKAVVEVIEVHINGSYKRSDQDIAQAALESLKWNSSVPNDKIQLKVENGWITLEGNVEWNYQREAAKFCINDLAGVRGITNLIEVKPKIEPHRIKEKIKNALKRNASIDAERISTRIEGHRVILEGTVQSWAEKKQAEKAAWAAPGVSEVENNIHVKLREYAM